MKRKPVCLNYLTTRKAKDLLNELPSIKMVVSQTHKSGCLISANHYKPICQITKKKNDRL